MIFGLVIAAIPAAMAVGFYRADGFFDWRYRWRKRKEDPRYFWATIFGYSAAALLFFVLAMAMPA